MAIVDNIRIKSKVHSITKNNIDQKLKDHFDKIKDILIKLEVHDVEIKTNFKEVGPGEYNLNLDIEGK